eukprot:3538812-Prymnesium_polylepis.1
MRGESVCAVEMRRAVRWTRAATAHATIGHEVRSRVGARSAHGGRHHKWGGRVIRWKYPWR